MRTEPRAATRGAAVVVMVMVGLGLLPSPAVRAAPPKVAATATAPAPAESRPPTRARGPARWYEVSPGDPRRFSIAGHFESQVIGLAFGLRAEALYRPFRFDRGANLRLGLGLQGGPEFFYLPLDVGWRQHFVPHRILTLELGAGYEQQTFFVPELRPISRPALYLDGGFAFQVTPGGWLGAQVVPSWGFAPAGPGLAVRVGFRWTLGARRAVGR